MSLANHKSVKTLLLLLHCCLILDVPLSSHNEQVLPGGRQAGRQALEGLSQVLWLGSLQLTLSKMDGVGVACNI